MSELHEACMANNIREVKYLIENGADVNMQDIQGYTILHIACDIRGNIDIVKYLGQSNRFDRQRLRFLQGFLVYCFSIPDVRLQCGHKNG